MTAPTPDLGENSALVERAKKYADPEKYFAKESPNYELVRSLVAALAAATADRDDARRELAEQKRINASNLRVMTEQLELARHTIADAPHGKDCASVYEYSYPCNCWKAGL